MHEWQIQDGAEGVDGIDKLTDRPDRAVGSDRPKACDEVGWSFWWC